MPHTAERRGRERWCHLEPGALRAVDDWLTPYRGFWAQRLDALDIMELELRHAEGQDSWTISCESLIGSATWVLLPPVFSMITPKKSECIQFVELFELLADAVVNNRPAET